MMRPYRQVFDVLRDAGLRPTRQRLGLARLLFDGGDRHVTAENLHAEALGAGLAVSVATIYNTLHQFTQAGLLREVVVDPGRSYFDTNISDHHHFFHESTGDLRDIPADAMEVARVPMPPAGTVVDRVEIVVRIKSA